MKKIKSILTIILAFCLCCMPVYAADKPYVVDEAELLEEEEESALLSKIEEIKNTYNFDTVILTINSLEGKTPQAYADDYFDYNGYGAGESGEDGILFLISMEDRDWCIFTKGYGITAFTDYGIDYIGEDVLSYLSDADYAQGFEIFLEDVDEFLSQAQNGEAYDNAVPVKEEKNWPILILIDMAIAAVVALIVVLVLKHNMNTARPNPLAQDYQKKGSFHLRQQSDVFLYSTVNKTKKPEPQQNGGSSTHTSSSGSSHGGGGGKF